MQGISHLWNPNGKHEITCMSMRTTWPQKPYHILSIEKQSLKIPKGS